MPRVLRYAAVHDVGRAINPQLIRGQVAGGIIHGMGGALYEHCDYDDGGQMLTASLMEYLCPTAVEAPQMTIEHHDSPSPVTLLGSKGVGENCAMSAPPPSLVRSKTHCATTMSRSRNCLLLR